MFISAAHIPARMISVKYKLAVQLDRVSTGGRVCFCVVLFSLGRPLGYSIFSLMALIRDPIY